MLKERKTVIFVVIIFALENMERLSLLAADLNEVESEMNSIHFTGVRPISEVINEILNYLTGAIWSLQHHPRCTVLKTATFCSKLDRPGNALF